MRCSGGVATGPGTRSRTQRSCHGSRLRHSSTRRSCSDAVGVLQAWNLILVISTFSLTILGTFLTRSGTIFSGPLVHPIRSRAGAPRIPRTDRCRLASPVCHAVSSRSLVSAARVAGEPRGHVPRQQPPAHPVRLHSPGGDDVSPSCGGLRGSSGERR